MIAACPDAPAPESPTRSVRQTSSRAGLVCAVVAWLLPVAAGAQSFDCSKAQGAVDQAICASPRLRQLDLDMAAAYAAALRRDTARADSIRQAEQSWARGRAACTSEARAPTGKPADSEQCLAAAYGSRLAALTAITAAEPVAPQTGSTGPARPGGAVPGQRAGAVVGQPDANASVQPDRTGPPQTGSSVSPQSGSTAPAQTSNSVPPRPAGIAPPQTGTAAPGQTSSPDRAQPGGTALGQSPATAPAAAATTPGQGDARRTLAADATLAGLGHGGEVFAPPRLATGLPAIPAGVATLARDRFPSAGETDTLLTVATPGRFAIRAESPTGTALQLVDMLTGPGERVGWPGRQNGRLDALLDAGTYKLRAYGDPAAVGDTTLSVVAFTAAGPAQLVPGYQPLAMALHDLELQSFWLVVGDSPVTTRIEAAGRSLAALKLWRDGRDLVPVIEAADIAGSSEPAKADENTENIGTTETKGTTETSGTVETTETSATTESTETNGTNGTGQATGITATKHVIAATPAHPMTDILLSGHLPPGSYLVTAYGGPALPWADGASEQPLYLRTGRSTGLLAGGASGQVGVFGTEAFDTPPNAASVLLTLPQPAEAHLSATAPGADRLFTDTAKNDRARAAMLDLPGRPASERLVKLRAAPGQGFTLRPLAAGRAAALNPGAGEPLAGTLLTDNPPVGNPPAGNPPSGKPITGTSPERAGRSWFGASERAFGGDEAPAAALLIRWRGDGLRADAAGTHEATPEVVASPGVPGIGPGRAWRTRFNLRGTTTLLFHATAVVTVAVHAEGPPVTPRITTLEGAVLNAMGNGNTATTWALSPGWYALVLTPKPKAAGILDLTLGPPGMIPSAPEAAGPEAPVLPLGEQSADAQTRFALLANRVPDGAASLLVRAVPLELADGPLVQTLPAGAAASMPVQARTAGILVTRDVAGGPPLERRVLDAGVNTTVTLPAADHARTLAVALLPLPSSATPTVAAAPSLAAVRDGEPAFLTLDRGGQASFAVSVREGGLYRVETTGRLKTAGRIGTAFIPVLGQATANGVGNNMLLQRYLRAGRYRLDVTARDSAGRLGVSATETPLADGADLPPGGSTRATLEPGNGVAFAIRIAAAGRYHLDLLGDGRRFSARLEDADGWPLRAAGDLSSIDQEFSPGRYRLIVQPPSVQARVVARLRRIEPPVALTGHGPHVLPFDAAQSLVWREPPGRDDPRTPDTWTFALAGPAKVTMSIDGDGMAAALQAEAADPAAPPLGRLRARTPLTVDLAAGRYRVIASSLGRNDRLAYTISLRSTELQPDTPRSVTLPADLPFAVAEARVMTLTSFGTVPLRAELRDAAGQVLARAAGRTDDWNIALSRFLPTGRYRLVLAQLAPPGGKTSDATDDARSSGSNEDAAAGDDGTGNGSAAENAGDREPGRSAGASAQPEAAADTDQGSAGEGPAGADQDQTGATPSHANDEQMPSSDNDQTPAGDTQNQASDDQNHTGDGQTQSNDETQPGVDRHQSNSEDTPADADQSQTGTGQNQSAEQDQAASGQGGDAAPNRRPARTESTLFLPADQPDVALAAGGTMVLNAGGIQHVTLPTPATGSLLVAAAQAQVELILAVEERRTDGRWETVGQSQGRTPFLGIPVGDAAAAQRVSVWTVDGETVPIRVAVRAVTATPTPIGSVSMAPVALEGITRQWNAALVADPGALMLRVQGGGSGLLAASSPDQPAAPPADGSIVAQSAAVWLLSPEPGSPRLMVVQPQTGAELTVAVPASERAMLPIGAPAQAGLCAYVAASGLGQPGLAAGRGMGVAPGSAFALCGGTTLSAWNAGGDEALRLRLRRLEVALQPDVTVDQAFSGLLPPHAAVKLHLPAAMHRLDVSLAAGGALVAGWQGADAVTAWAGDTALSRSLTGDWTDALLVNTADDPAPATLTVTAVTQPLVLASGGMFRRFFGADGSFELNLTAGRGQRLVLAGEATVTVQRPDGQVRQGTVVGLDGPANAVVTHGAGPLAMWIEGPGVSPWPDAAPRDVTLPQRLKLDNEAMALRLSPDAPVLLRLANLAPIILAVGGDPPVLFGKGRPWPATCRQETPSCACSRRRTDRCIRHPGVVGHPGDPGRRGAGRAGGHSARWCGRVRIHRHGSRTSRTGSPSRPGPRRGALDRRAWHDTRTRGVDAAALGAGTLPAGGERPSGCADDAGATRGAWHRAAS